MCEKVRKEGYTLKKIAEFIINKRHFILLLFIVLTVISAVLSTKVKINHDIAEYMPDTSETRIGMDIMEEEFSGTETSTLNIMFEELPEEEKIEVKEYLEGINGVDSVDYDNTEKYNKDKYTLYVITVDDKSDSTMAANVYSEITNKYEDYKIYTSGDISDSNKAVLPIWIIILAVACALVILLIMCESYVEPFIFLTTILMAVVLNKGTNLMFPSVSHITDSIAAILQMALSMDYSIMLMNRYDQEKEVESDKIKAMKNALHKALQSISSSSLTTIVGLLALVFMSFKIGKDLGFVLAKGVLFSLICIFFVLPSLILMFDKLIQKTKKKTLNIKLDILGKISYKARYIAVPLFLIIFIQSFMLKGNLAIDYTENQSNDVAKVFTENNQMAVIYKNEDEEKIAKYLSEIENNEKVDEVLAYGNTINQKLTYDQLNSKLNDLGSDVNVEDYLLKIVYYDYYNQNADEKMTFNEFVNFLESEAYNNEKANQKISDKMKNDVTRLKNFITVASVNKARTSSDIANILEIDKSKIDDIFIYYLSKNNNVKINLNEFINFMNKDVLTNDKYAAKINNDSKNQLNTLSKIANKQTIQKQMTSDQMAKLFDINSSTMKELYKYYILTHDIDAKLTIAEFSNFVLNNVLKDSEYSNSFDEKTIQSINMLAKFSNTEIINKQMTSKELANLFGIDETKISQLLLLKYMNAGNTNPNENVDNEENAETDTNIENKTNMPNINMQELKATPEEFVKLILDNKDLESIKNSIDETTMQQLQLLHSVMTSTTNNKKFTYQELSQAIGINAESTKSIYTLYVSSKNDTTLTPRNFVSFVLEHKNDAALKGKITNSTIQNLNLVQSVMNGVMNNKKYSSSELSNLLGLDKESVDLLYGLYSSKYVNKNPSLSLKEFVKFLLDDVTKNSEYSSNFEEEQITKLNTVNGIMNGTINNTKYTADEIFAIISKLSDDVEKNTIKMLYTYYGSSKNYDSGWQMTVEQFVNFLNDDILQDERFTDFIEDDMRNDITEARTTINDAKELLIGNEHSRIVLNTTFAPETPETFEFIQNVKDIIGKDVEDFYVIGNSPMAYEMSKTFDSELNTITVITMIAIFIVVAITFKSILLPMILVLTIQTAVYLTMGILSIVGENVYFIAILIVQSILMGATIDYAILYTSYYLEHRKEEGIKESIIDSYNKSIHTILTSSSILIIVTLIIANFASAIAAKICKTISEGTICSTILILVLLPAVLACCDRIIVKKKKA